MRRRDALRTTAAFVAALCLPGGRLAADPVDLVTARGTIALPDRPETIVALDMSAIDTLAALGRPADAVPSQLRPDWLAEQVPDAARVGSLLVPDTAAIEELSPDLIILGPRSARRTGHLTRIAPIADMGVGLDVPGDARARLQAFGAMLGRDETATTLAMAFDEKLAQSRGLVSAIGGEALIVMTSGYRITAFGPGSRFGWLHDRLGWGQAMLGLGGGHYGTPMTLEEIAAHNPDTLIVIDRGMAVGDATVRAAEIFGTPLVQGTRAAREGRILYLPPAEIFLAPGGIQSLTRVLDSVITALGGV